MPFLPVNIYKPELFHGRRMRGSFFEGWFYKIADHGGRNIIAIIPALFIDKNRAERHASIQFSRKGASRALVQIYPQQQFLHSPHTLSFRIGNNRFRSDGLDLDLATDEGAVRGQLTFTGLKPWPVKWTSPGAMGWFAFVPFMQCYHGVLSMDHAVTGTLRIDGQDIDFTGGRGYIEKDWGTAFPSVYIWMQCNHFGLSGTSVMASVANIPWLGGSFRGFIIGLLYRDRLLRFATYTGAKLLSMEVDDQRVELASEDTSYRIELHAERTKGVLLHGPDGDRFRRGFHETLSSRIHLRLSRRSRAGLETIFESAGEPAGLDVNGRLQQL